MTSTIQSAPVAPWTATAPPKAEAPLRSQLRVITTAWMFGTVWMYVVTGAAMTKFARELGLTDPQFGILAALPFAAALFQLPAAYLLERHGGRKATFIAWATASRLLWIAAALIPLALPGAPGWWPTALLLVLLICWSTGNYSGPAWMNWMADIVPRRVRGRYFSTRGRWTQPLGILTTLGVGLALDFAVKHEATTPGSVLRVTSLFIILAGIVGTIDIQCFYLVPDPGPRILPPRHGFWKRLRRPLADSSFRRLLAYSFTITFGVGFLGQYLWLFALEVVKMDNWTANVALVAVPLIVYMASIGAWGKFIDRFGKKPALILAASLFVAGPWGWFFATPEHWVVGYLLTLISPLGWGGADLAFFNIILDVSTPSGDVNGTRRRDGGSAYVAWNSVVAAIGGILSGVLGALVAKSLGSWTWTAPWGVPMHYHHVLLAISSALRVAAVCWALTLTEPRATGTRDAIRTVTGEVWSNVLQLMTFPAWVVGRIQRWSYRIDRPHR